MKCLRLMAFLLALTLLLAGCGTIEEDSVSLVSVPEDESWADLTPDDPSPLPETEIILPELSTQEPTEEEKIVTYDYIDAFLGIWDNEQNSRTYEFKSNENLVISTTSTGDSANYTYWFREVSGQAQLCVFQNGQEEAQAYSFTLSGNNLTLYDITSGNALEQLTRRVETVSTATPTKAPAQAPTPVPTQTPTAAPAPSTVPSPSAVPSEAPTVSPSAEPSPAPSPTVELPSHVSANMAKVECILDVLDEGKAFDASNSESFWNIMARYCSLSQESDDEGYITLSEGRILELAKQIFPNVTELPLCPEGSLAQLLPVEEGAEIQYKLLWGAAWGHEMEILSYENGILVIKLDGVNTYEVQVHEDGTVGTAGPAA